ncbi:MAG: serine/threonine-protein kinase [Acidimicrobiales bacterium]
MTGDTARRRHRIARRRATTPSLTSAPTVGRYGLEGVIGSGTSGTVFLAMAPDGARVAVKVLGPQLWADKEFLARFRAEATVMRRVEHPNCVRLIDLIDEPGVLAIVSELVNGATLRAVLDGAGPISGEQAVGILEGALQGLAHLHGLGLVHRDVKPANILVDVGGVSKLADFGLVRGVRELARGGQEWSGTPAYMSPEQARGDALDFRSDIYACGAVLFEALTGERPFDADSIVELLRLHREVPAPDPCVLEPNLHPALGVLITKALAKDPSRRQAGALELLEELRTAATLAYGPDWAKRAGVAGVVAGFAASIASTLAGGTASTVAGSLATLLPEAAGVELAGAVTPTPVPPPPVAPAAVGPPVAPVPPIAAPVTTSPPPSGPAGGPVQAPRVGRRTVSTTGAPSTSVVVTVSVLALVSALVGIVAAIRVTPRENRPTAAPTTVPGDPVLLGAVPECSSGACAVNSRSDGKLSSAGPASVILVRLPTQSLKLFVVAHSGQVVFGAPQDGFPRNDNPVGGLVSDRSGNVLLKMATGAHSYYVVVVRVTPQRVDDLGSFEPATSSAGRGRFFGDYSTGETTDVDGDGLLDISVGRSDYEPSFADGGALITRFAWNGIDYAAVTCETRRRGRTATTLPVSGAGECGWPAPSPPASPEEAATCVFQAYLDGSPARARPCARDSRAVDRLFAQWRPAPKEELKRWALTRCAPAGSPGAFECDFVAPADVPSTLAGGQPRLREFTWDIGAQANGFVFVAFRFD